MASVMNLQNDVRVGELLCAPGGLDVVTDDFELKRLVEWANTNPIMLHDGAEDGGVLYTELIPVSVGEKLYCVAVQEMLADNGYYVELY